MCVRLAPAIGLLLALTLAGAGRAADFTVTVHDRAGKPVKDAVVTIEAPGAGPARIEGPYEVVQQNLKFNPSLLIVPVGAEVAFPNKDVVRHHVYSFSPTKAFELKLYGRDQQVRTVKFDKPGVVALGCNIHDSMVGFIKVVSTPFAAKTGPDGRARLRGLPASGAATLKIWQPYQKTPNNEIARPVTLTAQEGFLTLALDLRTPPDRDQAY
jgi:plastocyanin